MINSRHQRHPSLRFSIQILCTFDVYCPCRTVFSQKVTKLFGRLSLPTASSSSLSPRVLCAYNVYTLSFTGGGGGERLSARPEKFATKAGSFIILAKLSRRFLSITRSRKFVLLPLPSRHCRYIDIFFSPPVVVAVAVYIYVHVHERVINPVGENTSGNRFKHIIYFIRNIIV